MLLTAHCQHVEVHINNKYHGLYVLMEKLDKSSLGINDSDSSALVFKEPHLFRESYKNISPQDAQNFHQQVYPKIDQTDKTAYVDSLRSFILHSSKDDFSAGFGHLFDIDNIIDWHILLLLTNNNDGILKNFYLYKKDADSPAKIAPWDYDHSLGRDGDNELNLNERSLNIERSILFKRLLEYNWYKKELKSSWKKYNDNGLITIQNLKQRIILNSQVIESAADRNFKQWPLDDKWYFDGNNFEDEINIMLQFVELRHKTLQEYFDEV